MKTAHLPLFALPLALFGFVAGCSDGGDTAGTGGSSSGTGGGGGGSAGAPGGAPGAAGQLSSGGLPAAGSPPTGGAPPATGGGGGAGGGGSGGGTAGAAGGSAGGVAGGAAGGGGTSTAGGGSGGGSSGSGGASGGGGSGGASGGTCTASKSTGKTVSGSGPYQVVIETNSDSGIKCGTIFRPQARQGTEKFPILVWGEGGCSQDGLSNQAALGEIASWGYFVVADGTPGGANACAGGQSGKAFLDYVTWASAENGKSCSAYYQSLDTTKIAADGFSCGGLMAMNVSADPRFSAIGITSSGLMAPNDALYDKIHTPFKIMNGGSGDIAYANGLRDYEEISARGKPTLYFSKSSAGHGGDLGQARGDFNKVNLAWLNWQLKGDVGATGKGYLTGATCTICTNTGWDYESANVP
jgi:hypothetical protein